MTTHELKTWPEYFEAIIRGDKSHEIRKDDRGFAVGDVLHLREWDPTEDPNSHDTALGYTGRSMDVDVTYVSRRDAGVPDGFVVMSIYCSGRDYVPSPTPTPEQVAENEALRERMLGSVRIVRERDELKLENGLMREKIAALEKEVAELEPVARRNTYAEGLQDAVTMIALHASDPGAAQNSAEVRVSWDHGIFDKLPFRDAAITLIRPGKKSPLEMLRAVQGDLRLVLVAWKRAREIVERGMGIARTKYATIEESAADVRAWRRTARDFLKHGSIGDMAKSIEQSGTPDAAGPFERTGPVEADGEPGQPLDATFRRPPTRFVLTRVAGTERRADCATLSDIHHALEEWFPGAWTAGALTPTAVDFYDRDGGRSLAVLTEVFE
jgi:hypothetical protein